MSTLPDHPEERGTPESLEDARYFQATIDALPTPVAFVNPDGRYQLSNRAFTLYFGSPAGNVAGRKLSEDLGENAWQLVRPKFDAALAGQDRDFEIELPATGGGNRVRFSGRPHWNSRGQVEGIVVTLADVRVDETAAAESRETELHYRHMADYSPVILWLTDADGACIQLNSRWEDITGLSVESGLNMGWLQAIYPDDRNDAVEQFRRAMRERRAFRMEYRLRHRQGNYHWSMVAASPRISPRGKLLGYIGSIIDIQDRKDAEEALRKSRDRFDIVKDAAQVGFWFCDLPFDVLSWDNRVKEHFWLPPEATVTIATFYEQIHPDDRERTRAAIAKSISERGRYDIEYRTVDAATRIERWIRAIGRTFYNTVGDPIRFDGVTLDITERRRSEDALRVAKEQAERASRAKDEFLAQLSHELRTPLTPVLMTATVLAENDHLPPETREQLTMIVRNVELEARLIDDLLDLTRITHGKLALRTELCDVHSLLALVVDIVSEDTREKQIKLTLDLSATQFHLAGDSARLQQVFWNLLRNAAKFTGEEGQIAIRSTNCPGGSGESGSRLQIEVVDNGVGFAPEMGSRLFEPFERGHAANDQRFPGLGLGLAIARAIVAAHGGNISATSAGVGQGATFTVELPGAHVAVPAPRPPAANAEPARPGKPARALRVLVVEDHQNTRDVLTRLLQRDGHTVTSAASVSEALAAAERGTFDLVLSDVGLPDASGLVLMKQLGARYGLKGVALSGYGMEEDLRRTAEAGFSAHLVKPIVLQEVRRVLHELAAEPK